MGRINGPTGAEPRLGSATPALRIRPGEFPCGLVTHYFGSGIHGAHEPCVRPAGNPYLTASYLEHAVARGLTEPAAATLISERVALAISELESRRALAQDQRELQCIEEVSDGLAANRGTGRSDDTCSPAMAAPIMALVRVLSRHRRISRRSTATGVRCSSRASPAPAGPATPSPSARCV